MGVWSDGQKFCFSHCGYFVPGHGGLNIEDIRAQLRNQQKDPSAPLRLPFDYTPVLREDAVAWLDKYGITLAERFKYKIGWSELYESLILPAFDVWGNLLVCQRRYFGTGDWPKYHTKGRPESVVWTARPSGGSVGNNPEAPYDGRIVIVEDYVSAIKIGRQAEAMPVWGSFLSNPQLNRLADRWSELVIWLDFNKTGEALSIRTRAACFFNTANVVSTEKDPKDYSDAEINNYLNQYVDA